MEKILLTGGTGTFGKAFIEWFLREITSGVLTIFSRDEYKQYQLKKKYNSKRLQFIVGDVRDKRALMKATYGQDYVIHAAALKQVNTLEYYPYEGVKTNLMGTENVILACLENNIRKAVLLSTDKAVEPVNAYGMSKALAEKLWAVANTYGSTKFVITRYGNVAGSRGSLIPNILHSIKTSKQIGITHPEATRFWLDIEQAVEIVIRALSYSSGGEIYIPKMRAFRVIDLIELFETEPEVIGLRPGEKIHEVITTQYEKSIEYELYITIYTLFYQGTLPVMPCIYKRRASNEADMMSKEELKEKVENIKRREI